MGTVSVPWYAGGINIMKFIASVSTILILIKISLLKETSTAEPLSETATLTSEYNTERASLGSFKIVIKNHWKTLHIKYVYACVS